MSLNNKQVLVCNCEGTMSVDTKAISKILNLEKPLTLNTQLCRSQIDVFEKNIKTSKNILIACTQEAPMFIETLDSLNSVDANLHFTNIRERAGWCKSASKKNVNAKMAALLSEAALDIPETPSVAMESKGEILILGNDADTLTSAQTIKDYLNVTIIISGKEQITPPKIMDFPIFQGQVESATGSLGRFDLKINNYSPAIPSSRQYLEFEDLGETGFITCDLILDLRGENSLFLAQENCDGYSRPDPNNPASISAALLKLSSLIGEFEKPIYIDYESNLCAHSRSEISGCTRCIDNCSVGAISPQGDNVEFDPFTCAGCGVCAAVCPTGAAKYTLPSGDTLTTRMRVLISTYLQAHGTKPIMLFHDTQWGDEMISSLARHYSGLPGNVLPFAVNSPFQLGLESIFSAAAYGVEHIIYLFPPKKVDEKNALEKQRELANIVFAGLGYGSDRVSFIDEIDPEKVSKILWDLKVEPQMTAGNFVAMGRKRSVMSLALNHLHSCAPAPADTIVLPDGAPFGNISINTAECTLCLSCVGACPTGALKANNDKPQLSFSETACVQCGLCKNTCPESVITLQPRLNFLSEAHSAVILKEESPFECIKCGEGFGSTSTVNKMLEKLQTHPMFTNGKALDRLKMCDNCRIIDMTNDQDNPMALGTVPKPRTTEDYLQEREELRREAAKDMMSKGLLPPKGEA